MANQNPQDDNIALKINNPYKTDVRTWIRGCNLAIAVDVFLRGSDSPKEGIPAVTLLISRLLDFKDENRSTTNNKIVTIPFSHTFVCMLVDISNGKDYQTNITPSVYIILYRDINKYLACHENRCVEFNNELINLINGIKLTKDTVNGLLIRNNYFFVRFLPLYTWTNLDAYFSTTKKENWDMLIDIITNTPDLKQKEGVYKLFFIVMIFLYYEDKRGSQNVPSQIPNKTFDILTTIIPQMSQEQIEEWSVLSLLYSNSPLFCKLVQLLNYGAEYVRNITESPIFVPNLKINKNREVLYRNALLQLEKCSTCISLQDILTSQSMKHIDSSKRRRETVEK